MVASGFAQRLAFTMIVFVHIPKTGGTSFRYILESNFGMRHCHAGHAGEADFSESDWRFARKIFPSLRGIAGHNLVNATRLPFPDPFFVTILRDPVARVISHYHQLKRRWNSDVDFERALREWGDLENLHVKLMVGERNLDKAKFFLEKQCGFVGFTEKFDLSMHVFGKLSPIKLDVSYLKRRITPDKSTKNKLQTDTRLLEMAREANRLDVELYAFALNEVFPRLCEKAGIPTTNAVPRLDTQEDRFQFKYAFGRFYNRLVYRELAKLRRRENPANP